MCRNGTKVNITSNLDDECFLTVVTGGEVCSIFVWYKVYSLRSISQTVVMISGVTIGKILFMAFWFITFHLK